MIVILWLEHSTQHIYMHAPQSPRPNIDDTSSRVAHFTTSPALCARTCLHGTSIDLLRLSAAGHLSRIARATLLTGEYSFQARARLPRASIRLGGHHPTSIFAFNTTIFAPLSVQGCWGRLLLSRRNFWRMPCLRHWARHRVDANSLRKRADGERETHRTNTGGGAAS